MRSDEPVQAEVPVARMALIGFAGGFPEFLKRLIKAEYPSVLLLEYDSLSQLLVEPDIRLSVMLIDETQCDELHERSSELQRKFGHSIAAVAFNGHSVSERRFRACLASRVVGSFLPMDMRIEVWLAAIGLMLKGGRYISPAILDNLLEKRSVNGHPENFAETQSRGFVKEIELLTPREMEVLDLVAQGQQNKIIAAELGLSENTVKLHLHHIITKLNASNRTEAAACYHVHMAAVRTDVHAK